MQRLTDTCLSLTFRLKQQQRLKSSRKRRLNRLPAGDRRNSGNPQRETSAGSLNRTCQSVRCKRFRLRTRRRATGPTFLSFLAAMVALPLWCGCDLCSTALLFIGVNGGRQGRGKERSGQRGRGGGGGGAKMRKRQRTRRQTSGPFLRQASHDMH